MANSRRDFLRLLTTASVAAPLAQSATFVPPHLYVSKTPPLSDAAAELTAVWGEELDKTVSANDARSANIDNAEWDTVVWDRHEFTSPQNRTVRAPHCDKDTATPGGSI